MTQPPGEVSADEKDALVQLGHRVVAALTRAGLPARLVEWTGVGIPAAGANVWVDPTDDRSCGIYIAWDHDPEVTAAVRRAVETLDLTDAGLPFAAAALQAMRRALVTILEAAGFEVAEPSEYSGAQVMVPLTRG